MLVTVCFLGVLFGSAVSALTKCDDVKKTAEHLGITHTLCRPQSSYASTPISSLSAAEQDEIVDYHNEIRRNVDVDATNMLKMEWDDDLANLAMKWASSCVDDGGDGHDDNLERYIYGKTDVGQNIHMSSYKGTWTDAMKGWAKEKQKFTYGAAPSGTVGHYTQMIWATSHKVGCGHAHCSNFADYTHRYVCNYGPAGNEGRLMTTPYKSGAKASDCGDKNDNGLCDCTGTDCYNDGTLNPATCTCTCHNEGKTTTSGDDCGKLSCNGDFPGWCAGFKLSQCGGIWKYCSKDRCNWCGY